MTPTLSAPTLPIPSLPTPSLLGSLFYRCNNNYAGVQLNFFLSRINFSSCTFCLQLMLSLPSIIYSYIIIFYYTSSFYATLTPCPPAFTTYVHVIIIMNHCFSYYKNDNNYYGISIMYYNT